MLSCALAWTKSDSNFMRKKELLRKVEKNNHVDRKEKKVENTAAPSSLLRFFSNPTVGVIGSIASIIGVLLAIFFFRESTRERKLTYFVNPVKSIIVQTGETSGLSVSFRGNEIKGDVTAAQIAFWNAGKEPIRPQNLLRPFVIQTKDNIPILESRIRKENREVVELQLDQSKIEQGKVGVSWAILEEGDGGVIQIIFAGGTSVDVSVSAIIEGQREIRSIEFGSEIRPPTEPYSSIARFYRQRGIMSIVLTLLLAAVMVWMFVLQKHRKEDSEFYQFVSITLKIYIIVAIFAISMAVYFLHRAQDIGPPFGF